jgi:hypothetical protein
MRRTLISFVLAVDACALAVLAALLKDGIAGSYWILLLLAVLAALAGARPVHIRSLRYEITATHPFIFLALAMIGPLGASLVAMAGILGAAVGRGRRWPRPIRFVFNLGAAVLSTSVAFVAFSFAGGSPGQNLHSLIFPLVAATIAYFVANTGLVAAAIALERRGPFFSTWRASFPWTIASYATGLTLAIAMLAVGDDIVTWGIVLAAPTCWFMTLSYREQAVRLEPAESR